MRNSFTPVLLLLACLGSTFATLSIAAAETEKLMLSGTGSDDTVEWEFKVNGGRNSGDWSTIPVPSNWEMQGFGTYHYWTDFHGADQAPDSLGQYRHSFTVPPEWNGKNVSIVIGAAMTDTDVRINGVSAGPTHQGGFYEFSYDVSKLLKYGEANVLEVDVQKYSSNHSVNIAEREADFWLFGGIFRPVWLEAKPASHIDRLAVDARDNGSFSVDVYLEGIEDDASLVAEILTLEGKRVTKSKPVPIESGQTFVQVKGVAKNVEIWTAEWPNLYKLQVTLRHHGSTTHMMDTTVGFRTVEVRPKDGIYVNGERIVLQILTSQSSP